ncbi:MAG: hypothetical protein PVS3B3_33270 [Ktedonobacteraceae bacterium]
MSILLHNYIADMPGPNFLFFYALVIIIVWIVYGTLLSNIVRSNKKPLPVVPKEPNILRIGVSA